MEDLSEGIATDDGPAVGLVHDIPDSDSLEELDVVEDKDVRVDVMEAERLRRMGTIVKGAARAVTVSLENP
ncbi:hypothetical protein PHLCEN_2v1923 [Hermanssonia centrifuga]|uniref:Uncharacterized protein n=1 Tax=Hermanssonia centrifuga TaxID=98765 RepID=A0A2R6RVG4_9APHY|nr:hypothetical protein PHLCEN_2v1923 [Hermanssonia centrifuga]